MQVSPPSEHPLPSPRGRSRETWLWTSAGFSVSCTLAVAATVVANISTLAGDPGGEPGLRPLELPLLVALLLVALTTAWMLGKAWRSEGSGTLRPVHGLPILASGLVVAVGLLLPIWRALELLLGDGGAPY